MKLQKWRWSRTGLCVALAICATGLTAWDDCGCDRVEFVTPGVGDAVEVNKATQTIDPWPPYVKNRRLNLNGKRAEIAMRRYESNRVLRPMGLNTPTGPQNSQGYSDPQNGNGNGAQTNGGYPANAQPQQ